MAVLGLGSDRAIYGRIYGYPLPAPPIGWCAFKLGELAILFHVDVSAQPDPAGPWKGATQVCVSTSTTEYGLVVKEWLYDSDSGADALPSPQQVAPYHKLAGDWIKANALAVYSGTLGPLE